ncbi:enoyl-CoA hydratase-related protein [Pseudonocardia kujensis]|uniref:enoyl-CoA hydratase/isomerase family protein n=1 Tax=Pseudonocardia kujensis TaxID=1128675 RepID=UPI001E39B67E|nr:enoyl-CoA hydratase-related protein [Pseudonocardia kujensis]MCE0761893.1 enoyl-CoA hydratase-related protein [Pseudonocardia kujensis]
MIPRPVDAEEALRLGFVNAVAEPEDFADTVQEWARKVAAKSPLLMRLGKDAIAATRDLALPEALDSLRSTRCARLAALDSLRSRLALAFSTQDIKEGVAAFREKRDPVWSMR